MHNIIIRLKSGREIKFACETYRFEKSNINGKLLSFEYTGGVGECPVYLNVDDVEVVMKIIDEDGEA